MTHPLHGAAVGFIKIPVRDFAAACAFYRDTLGLTEDFAVAEFGWAQYATGSVPICIYVAGKGGGEGTPGGETGVQLRVSDARRAHEHLKSHAGELTVGDDGTTAFVVRDPDGNRLQIAQTS
ncbi:MAG: VOC family protein [Planctomycetota bacterium]